MSDDPKSPEQLAEYITGVLGQLQNKFDDMSNQIGTKMNTLGDRVASLESQIDELLEETTEETTNQQQQQQQQQQSSN
ncbi:MAG: hypothetical protein SGCHY_002327 [Lobulomycetales sp.]